MTKKDFFNSWRPLLAYIYMAICIFDFIVFPIMWSAIQVYHSGNVTLAWSPISLQGGGLVHLSFGGAISIAAHGRTKERLSGLTQDKVNNE